MAKNQSINVEQDDVEDIIDLTEIVQQGKIVPQQAASGVNFDKELSDLKGKKTDARVTEVSDLDDLLADLDEPAKEGSDNPFAPKGMMGDDIFAANFGVDDDDDDDDDEEEEEEDVTVKDASRSANVDDLPFDDVDDLINSLQAPDFTSEARSSQAPEEDVDAMLDSLVGEVNLPKTETAGAALQDISDADLDDLLSSIERESRGETANTSSIVEQPDFGDLGTLLDSIEEDAKRENGTQSAGSLDSILDEVISVPTPEKAAAKPNFDGIFEELDKINSTGSQPTPAFTEDTDAALASIFDVSTLGDDSAQEDDAADNMTAAQANIVERAMFTMPEAAITEYVEAEQAEAVHAEEVARLTEEVARLTEKVEQAEATVQTLDERVRELEKQPSPEAVALEALNDAASPLFGRVTDLLQTAIVSATQPLAEKLDAVQAKAELADVLTRLDALETRLDGSTVLARLDAIEGRMEESNVLARMDALEARLENSDVLTRLDALEARLDSTDILTRVNSLEARFDASTPVDAVVARLDDVQQAVAALDRQLGDVIQQFSNHIDELQVSIADRGVQNELHTLGERVDALSADVAQRLEGTVLIAQLLPQMGAAIERAAAESAARVLREELAQLMNEA